MKRLTLIRWWHGPEMTLGELYHGEDFLCYTLEPGQKDIDAPRVPTGFYYLEPHGWEEDTPLRYKRTWALVGKSVVHQEGDDGYEEGIRTAVLMHAGNRDDDTLGCIITGTTIGRIGGETGVLGSRDALERVRDRIGEAAACLVIRGG